MTSFPTPTAFPAAIGGAMPALTDAIPAGPRTVLTRRRCIDLMRAVASRCC